MVDVLIGCIGQHMDQVLGGYFAWGHLTVGWLVRWGTGGWWV